MFGSPMFKKQSSQVLVKILHASHVFLADLTIDLAARDAPICIRKLFLVNLSREELEELALSHLDAISIEKLLYRLGGDIILG
ncbi:hypothetical protein NW765_016339 [Fusarium oxysporum]|nr:hypothetical protein NW765_016339 [Fusarium oxysporum]KAJ4265247.1 hypothetical protein NW764_015658 [Fusarium oxysporum]